MLSAGLTRKGKARDLAIAPDGVVEDHLVTEPAARKYP